jgi:flagellar operon protein
MNRIGNQFSTIEQVTNQYFNTGSVNVNNAAQASDISFADVLKEKQTTVRFSKHAAQRLESRNISLSDEQSTRLENGINQASDKGINESLVLVDSLAFIVNVPNRTVVTAMDQTETQSNIFTNIDGAVIM